MGAPPWGPKEDLVSAGGREGTRRESVFNKQASPTQGFSQIERVSTVNPSSTLPHTITLRLLSPVS